MKHVLIGCFLALSMLSFSQQTIDVDKTNGLPLNAFYTVSGTPFVNYRFVRLVEGSPYFSTNWMAGLVLAEDGKLYKTGRVRLDLLDNQLIFLTDKDEEFICTMSLKEISLTDSASNRIFSFVYSPFVPALAGEKQGWYQQLANGKVSLFAAHLKTVQEAKPYGSSVAEQRIYTRQEYLVVHKGSLLKVKKPRELPALLADRKAELDAYLKKDDVRDLSPEDQMTALVNFYNSL